MRVFWATVVPLGSELQNYMIDCFEVMYEEGADHPKLMSLALHDRLTGRPGRITGLIKFLDRITARDRVWICTPNRRASAAGASELRASNPRPALSG